MERDEPYYFISSYGALVSTDSNANRDGRHNAANYCTDHDLMYQRALHETLDRLLWRYSMEHDGDKIALNHCWGISHSKEYYEAHELWGHIVGESVFYDKKTAQDAIKEVIEPFVKAHPEFKW